LLLSPHADGAAQESLTRLQKETGGGERPHELSTLTRVEERFQDAFASRIQDLTEAAKRDSGAGYAEDCDAPVSPASGGAVSPALGGSASGINDDEGYGLSGDVGSSINSSAVAAVATAPFAPHASSRAGSSTAKSIKRRSGRETALSVSMDKLSAK